MVILFELEGRPKLHKVGWVIRLHKLQASHKPACRNPTDPGIALTIPLQ